jgi:hypothetical protein
MQIKALLTGKFLRFMLLAVVLGAIGSGAWGMAP